MSIEKNQPQQVTIERMAHGGEGVGRLADGRVVFVPTTLPGEAVEVQLVELKKSFGRGEVRRVITPSSARVASECPFFDACGGCQYWHTDYAMELELKADAAWETMSRISGVALPAAAVVAAPTDRGYRSRVVFHQKAAHSDRRTGRQEPNRIGFYRTRSNDLLDVDDCLISETILNEARRALEPALRDVGDCDIVLETADASSVVATIIPARDFGTRIPRSLREFAQTILHNPLFRGLRVVGAREDVIFGENTVDADQILARPPLSGARLAAGEFRQSYRRINQLLVERVAALVQQYDPQHVLELYCGSGNFSFAMPAQIERLVGLESSEAAVNSAAELAAAAQLDRYEFCVHDLSGGLTDTPWARAQGFDLVLLDPPRTGAAQVCAQLADATEPSTIIYVSCDPACLARDLKTLCAGGWQVDSLALIDLFPRTAHIESIAVLRRATPAGEKT